MNNLDKIKRHLGKPIPITLTYESEDGTEEKDVFDFKPLNIEQQAILMELSRAMDSRGVETVEGVEVPMITKEDTMEMFNLMLDIVKTSFEGIEEKTAEDFVNNNFNQLFNKMNLLMPKRDNSEALKKIKKKQEERRNAKSEKQA